MAITLGSVSLPDAVEWTDRAAVSAVQHATRRTLSGRFVVSSRPLSGGRAITLEIPADVTCSRADQIALEALASVPGAVYALAIPNQGFSASVMIESLEFTPLFDYADPVDDDPVHGTIKLFTV